MRRRYGISAILPATWPAADQPVRVGRVGEREGAAHEHAQPALGDQPHQVQPGRAADLGAGIGARRAAQHLQAQVERAPGSDDGGDAAPVGDQLQRDVGGLVGADQVQRRVDALARGRPDPVRQPVAVSHGRGAQLAQELVPGRGGGGDDHGAPPGGQLDRHGAHAARRAVDQHGVALRARRWRPARARRWRRSASARWPGPSPARAAWAPARRPGPAARPRRRRGPGTR